MINKFKQLDKKKKILVGVLGTVILIAMIFLIFFIIYLCNIGCVSNNNDIKKFTVSTGDTYYSIASKLKKQNLIKSEFFYKIYIKLNKLDNLKYGEYDLRENMSVKQITELLSKGTVRKGQMVTFKEGLNIRQIAILIENKTNNKQDDVFELLQDEEYIDSLIEKYWFLTDEIKNKKIYYPLEGYLFPETYEFFTDTVTVKEIFDTMLNETGKRLEKYKEQFQNSKYTIHEILTLASIVELEGTAVSDRKDVAGVFMNRLKSGWSLGSDVTTYYGAKVNMSERDLYWKEINEANAYNTRSATMAGKLPVSPICNSSISSIESALNPNKNNYYYFVADKNGRTYFTKTQAEHTAKISELKRNGLWYTY